MFATDRLDKQLEVDLLELETQYNNGEIDQASFRKTMTEILQEYKQNVQQLKEDVFATDRFDANH